MFRSNYLIPFAGVVVLASCSDMTAPLTQAAEHDIPQIVAAKGGKGGEPSGNEPSLSGESGDPSANVLRQAPSAPPFESYEVSFWAVRGIKAGVEVHYTATMGGDGDIPPRFLKFQVPARGLLAGPDGIRFARGDSVLITLTIDPVEFRVDFAPSGLVFDPRDPAILKLAYKYVDEDVDKDGDVDADDRAILDSALTAFHYETVDSPWSTVPSHNDIEIRTVKVFVPHFSGFAVSW